MLSRHLSLIGYRGTGKSTVARHLALLLSAPWVDCDVALELRAGKSIAALFADDGEPAFRDLESRVLADELARPTPQILACGGGIVLRAENRQLLKSQSRVVWLTARPETLWSRVQADQSTAARRPALTTRGGLDEIVALLQQRAPWYAQCAEWEVDTEDRTPPELAAEIVARLKLHTSGKSSA